MKAHASSAGTKGVHKLVIPDAVRSSGIASPEVVAEAVSYLHRDGIIILGNTIDLAHLDALEAVLGPEAEELAKDPDHHFNFGKGTRNIDQAPPLIPRLMYQDIWANPIVCSILKMILGPELVCHYANGNTALPKATQRQPVHSDIEGAHSVFPFAYIINIPLDDVSTKNGSTEFWIGSHRDSCIDQHVEPELLQIKSELVEERRKHAPPVYPSMKKGDLIIRDIRLWHAGVPNRSDKPRIMLAWAIQPKWFQAPSKVLLPVEVRSLVEGWQKDSGLEYNAQWVDGLVDHRKVASVDVDFNSTNTKILELTDHMHPPAY